MNDAVLVWGVLFVPWVFGVVLLAHSRRYATPNDDLSAEGWIAVVILAICLFLFFFSAAWQFGRVVWVIPMLGFWAFILWLTFNHTKRHIW